MSLRKYKANRRLLVRLFKKQKGICCYCHCKTVLPASGYQGKQPLNAATIEHIYNNYSIIRMILPKWAKTKMACWECNHKRGYEDTRQYLVGYDYRETHDGLLLMLLNKPDKINSEF